MRSQKPKRTRRRAVLAALGGATISLVGCMGRNDDPNGDGTTPTETATETPATDPTLTETPTEMSTETSPENGEETSIDLDEVRLELALREGDYERLFDPIENLTRQRAGDGWGMSNSAHLLSQVHSPLLTYPEGVQNEPQSIFLEEYEATNDHTVHRIRIKEGISYHDNPVKDEVTADDFKFSLRRMSESDDQHRILMEPFLNLEYETADDGIGSFNIAPDGIAVDVLDDYTFELTVSDPDPHLLRKLSDILFAPIPEGIVGDVQGYDGEMSLEEFGIRSPVGCGPYEIEAYDGNEVILSRFDDYRGEGASIPEIRFQILDQETAYKQLREGELDAGPISDQSYDRDAISVDSVDEVGVRTGSYTLSDGTVLDYRSAELPQTYYIGMRADKIPRDVRRAICHVFDRDWIDEHLPTARKTQSFVPGSIWPQGYEKYQEFAAKSPYSSGSDRTAAEQELADRSDSYNLTLSVYEEGGTIFRQSGARSKLQNRLAQIGINLNIEEYPYTDFLRRGRKRELGSFYFGWADIHADPLSYLSKMAPNSTVDDSSALWINWDSGDAEHADRAQEAYNDLQNHLGDGQQLAETISRMERARRSDAVILPLFNTPLNHISHRWVDLPTPSPNGQAHTRHAQSEFVDVPARLRD